MTNNVNHSLQNIISKFKMINQFTYTIKLLVFNYQITIYLIPNLNSNFKKHTLVLQRAKSKFREEKNKLKWLTQNSICVI